MLAFFLQTFVNKIRLYRQRSMALQNGHFVIHQIVMMFLYWLFLSRSPCYLSFVHRHILRYNAVWRVLKTNRWTSSVHENLLYLTLKMHSVSLHDDWYYISRFKMQPVDNLLDNNTHAAQSCGMMYDFSRVAYFPIG